jgi:hypothetical protein
LSRHLWLALYALTAAALGGLGVLWSDWFLLAGATGAAAAATWQATEPTNR